MKIAKIIVGVLFLFGGVRNLTQIFVETRNPAEAAGYMIPTLFFLIMGGWLLYSGVRTPPAPNKIYDDSDDETP